MGNDGYFHGKEPKQGAPDPSCFVEMQSRTDRLTLAPKDHKSSELKQSFHCLLYVPIEGHRRNSQ